MIKDLRFCYGMMLFIFMVLINNNEALSKTEAFIKLQQFERWDVVSKIVKGKKFCHAVATPYKTDVFSGEKGLAVISLSYKGKQAFTFSINPGIELRVPNGVEVILSGKGHGLYASKQNAVTYSIVQDIALLNTIMTDTAFIKTRTYGRKGDLIEDFYSVEGLKEAMLYMDLHCQK